MNFVARRGSKEKLTLIAKGLVDNLKAFIMDQGWPVPDRDQDLELRGYGFETIGLLAKAAPEILLEPSLELLEWLFRSLREDTSGRDVAVSIEEALSSVLGAFVKPMDPAVQSKFRQVLLKYATMESSSQSGQNEKFSRSTRYVATRFANRCLPYDDVLGRWIDVLAASGGNTERHEILEEGRKGLDPYWFSMSNSEPGADTQRQLPFPEINQLVRFIFVQQLEDDDDMDVDEDDDDDDVVAQFRQFQQRHANATSVVLDFCIQVAIHAALSAKDIQHNVSEDWGRKLDTLLSTDQRARQAFRVFASDDAQSWSLAILLRASFESITRTEGEVGDAGSLFVRLCSLCPEKIWKRANLILDFRDLESSVFSNNVARRAAAAHAYGLLASQKNCDTSQVQRSTALFFEKLKAWKSAVGGELNQISGVIIALGYLYSRVKWRGAVALSDDHPVYQLLEIVLDVLQNSKDATLKAAAFSCIDQLSLFQAITPATITKYAKFQDIVEKIFDSAKAGTTAAIVALGHFSLITEESAETTTEETSDYNLVADKLYELHEVRQSEVQFSVGEALSCFALGWDSKVLITELDIEHPDQKHDPWDAPILTPSGPKREKTLRVVLEKTLKGCRQSKPSLKKASVIWLLCLLQYCGHKPEMQEHLPQCQNAFKACLSNRDDVVQEAASRGLGLVYEKGDRQLKDDLVRDLVGSFSDNKSKLAGNVSEDTELFEPGALPTGEGKSVTTYKDILSLAAEVGDSSLVYRFMSLASNNSIWSSRAAFGRFGLSNVFSDSSVDGYLAENPKLYPKLYRYR
jgi:proteasome component ECM29